VWKRRKKRSQRFSARTPSLEGGTLAGNKLFWEGRKGEKKATRLDRLANDQQEGIRRLGEKKRKILYRTTPKRAGVSWIVGGIHRGGRKVGGGGGGGGGGG